MVVRYSNKMNILLYCLFAAVTHSSPPPTPGPGTSSPRPGLHRAGLGCGVQAATGQELVHGVEAVDAHVVRCCQIQNVSLVITYTGVVVAALMMAGFLYIALNYGRGRSRYLSSISVISRYIYNYL